MGWKISTTLAFAVVAMLSLPTSAGQNDPAGNQATDDEAPGLVLQVDATARVQLGLVSSVSEPFAREMTRRMGQSLGCQPVSSEEDDYDYQSSCPSPAIRSLPFVYTINLDLGPVRDGARKFRANSVWIYLRHPKFAFFDCSPCQSDRENSREMFTESLLLHVEDAAPSRLRFSYGYRWSDLARDLSPLIAALLLPVFLTLWMRRVAIRSAPPDREAAWFGYSRFLSLQTLIAWLVWLGLVSMPRVNEWISFVSGASRSAESVAMVSLIWGFLAFVPMAVVTIICRTLSYPVFAWVHGSQWSRHELLRQAAWSQMVFVVPMLGILAGLWRIQANDSRGAAVLFAVALGSWVIATRRLTKATGRTPQTIAIGELRDRVYEIARKAGVKMKNLYVLSAGKSRMANAFAAAGNTVMLTDYLLNHLTRREVDAVVAHELTHLKRKHIALRILVGLSAGICVAGLLQGWMKFGNVPLFVALILLTNYFVSRRFERSADAGAAVLTDDPEAVITALAKITRLNVYPLQWSKWSESLLAHPSTTRRAEAIAARFNIPPVRVSEILISGTTGADYYALPAAYAGEGKIFSTKFKTDVIFRLSWLYAGILSVIPAAWVRAILKGHLDGPKFYVAWLAGTAFTFSVYLIAGYFLPFSQSRRIAGKLRARLESQSALPGAEGGYFVGFAPDSVPRLYDANYSWDLGFLFLLGDRIAYAGEETQFSLSREEVCEVGLCRGAVGWIHATAVRILWKQAAEGKRGEFVLRPQHTRSAGELRMAARELVQKLEQWRVTRNGADTPSGFPHHIPPLSGTVSSLSPRVVARATPVMRSLIFLGVLSGLAGAIFDLSYVPDVLEPGMIVGLAGWHALAGTILLGILQFIPYWFSKEPRRAPTGDENSTSVRSAKLT